MASHRYIQLSEEGVEEIPPVLRLIYVHGDSEGMREECGEVFAEAGMEHPQGCALSKVDHTDIYSGERFDRAVRRRPPYVTNRH